MKVTILFFGQLADITGDNTIDVPEVTDTAQLKTKLHALYPALGNAKYFFAVNNNMVDDNTLLSPNATVALLPPFSGG